MRLPLFLALVSIALAGCSSKPKTPPKPPTVKVLRQIHHVGGTHSRTVIHDDLWYQTFDNSLLVMSHSAVTPLKTIALGKDGESGPAVDMLIDPRADRARMFLVIEDDEAVELSLENPRLPTIVSRVSAKSLGIRPRRLSEVDGVVYVSGVGGVVRLDDRARIFTSDEDVSRVARSGSGLIACAGRRVYRLDNGNYVGSASDVQMLQPTSDAPAAGTIVFVRQSDSGSLVGLMTPDVREVDAAKATVAVPGQVRSVRVIGDRMWITSDDAVVGYRIGERSLNDPIRIDVLGARDVGMLNENELAIAGTFGRTIYRLTSNNPNASPFVHVHREPSRLSTALTDGQYTLAGSREGLWMYLINSRAELTARQFESHPPPPSISAVTKSAQARISEDGRSVTIAPTNTDESAPAAEKFTYSEPDGCTLRCVAAVDGDFWIGHDRGVTVIKSVEAVPVKGAAPRASDRILGRLRFAGPVLHIHPLLVGGGASFVSEFGGFGVAKFIEEPIGAQN